ncbi:MAG: tetratricopeptide repeat protein [Ignavibacteriaceae bacterium]|nr:tetratricopeptide repeat protein [Ignavibacteriaceae bacterium]
MYLKLSTFFLLIQFFALAQTNDENNRFLLAQNFEQAGEFARAKQIYSELYAKNPGFYSYFEALNRMYIQLKEYNNSTMLLSKELSKKPGDINIIILLGRTYYISGNESKTDSLWGAFLASAEHNTSVYRAFANSALELRNFDKAIVYLKEARERTKDKVALTYDIANLLALRMQYQDAAKELLTVLDIDPNNIRSVESRILSNSQKPGAVEEFTKYVEANAPKSKPYHRFLLATLYRESGRFREALEILKQLDIPLINNGGEFISFASIAAQENEFAIAAEAYSHVISAYAKSPYISQAKLGLAKNLNRSVYLQLADSASAWKPFLPVKKFDESGFRSTIDSYSEIVKTFPHSEPAIDALFSLAKVYYDCGNNEKGGYYINEIVKNYPMSAYYVPALILSAKENLNNGKIDEANSVLQKIGNSAFNSKKHMAEVQFLKARIHFFKNEFTTAAEIISAIYIELRDNQVNDALEFSLLTNINLSDSVSLALFAGAEMDMLTGKFDDAYKIYTQLAGNENLHLLKHFAGIRMMEIDIALNRYREAVERGKSLSAVKLNIFADRAAYYTCLVNLYGRKETAEAAQNMEEFLEKFPSSLYFDNIRNLLLNLKNKNI